MSRIKFVNRVRDDFGMVPRALWRSGLSFAAKGLASYLCCVGGDVAPTVAEVERDCGIGRDARRKAFAALERVGFISWEVERKADGSFITRALVVDPMVLANLPSAGEPDASDRLPPESQAVGPNALPPDNPAGGFSGAPATETRRSTDVISGGQDLKRERKKERAALARSAVQQPRRSPLGSGGGASVDLATLSPFERSRIQAGQSVTVGGVLIQPGSPQAETLRSSLRRLAENGGGL